MNIKSTLKIVNQELTNHFIKDSIDFKTEIINEVQKIDNHFFSGNSQIIKTNGFFLIHNTFKINKCATELIEVDREYIQISIAIKGESNIIKQDELKTIPKELVQLSFKNNKRTEIQLVENEDFEYIRIFISRFFFLNLLKDEHWVVNDQLYQAVLAQEYIEFGLLKYHLNYDIINIINQLEANAYTEEYAHYYLHQKLKEMFFIHHTNLKELQFHESNSEDGNSLTNAKEYLKKHYQNPPTIQELSRIVFMNEFKLKKEFKATFGITIHQYAIKVRMKNAVNLLKQQQQIKEVAYQLGYKNASHFIANFKSHYGYTPNQYLKGTIN